MVYKRQYVMIAPQTVVAMIRYYEWAKMMLSYDLETGPGTDMPARIAVDQLAIQSLIEHMFNGDLSGISENK